MAADATFDCEQVKCANMDCRVAALIGARELGEAQLRKAPG